MGPTNDERLMVEAYDFSGYEPLADGMARLHTTTWWLAHTGQAILYRDGLAEQLHQHTPRQNARGH